MRTDKVAVDGAIRSYVSMREQLLQMCPELADDDAALLDTLEGETNLVEVIAAMARASKVREAEAKAMKDVLDQMRDRQARHKRAAEALRAAVIDAMNKAGRDRVKVADLTVTVKDLDLSFDIIESDIEMIPDEYVKSRQVKEIDKEKVLAAIQNGLELPFVVIHNDRQSVTIRI
jgi:chromosome segregation ATPase